MVSLKAFTAYSYSLCNQQSTQAAVSFAFSTHHHPHHFSH